MNRLDFDAPPWDQKTFVGRLKYFFWVTDPRLAVCSDATLDEAKKLRDQYLAGNEPPGTSQQQVMLAKQIYESAFHPDSGEKMNVFGRMSFQVPGGMLVTGAMLTFYKTTTALVFWQWVNQSFNALVNYTNRNAKSPLTETQMAVAYVTASSAACFTAMGLKGFLSKRAGPMMQRYVPFAAVAAANCANIPLLTPVVTGPASLGSALLCPNPEAAFSLVGLYLSVLVRTYGRCQDGGWREGSLKKR